MYFGTKERFDYFSCAGCETLQAVRSLTSQELGRHYPSDYYSYKISDRPSLLKWFKAQHDRYMLHVGGKLVGAIVEMVPKNLRTVLGAHDSGGDVVAMLGELSLRSDARIVDVGCGSGGLLDRLSRSGFTRLLGVDPFLPSDGETPEGVRLVKGYLDDLAGPFDLIMFNHSLEHVPDPVATLGAVRERLAADGVCLVRLPTTSSDAWNHFRSDWINLDAPRHIVIPSRQGMAIAAESVGLRVEKSIDDSTFLQFLGSEAYRHDIPLADPNFSRKTIRLFGPKRIWKWQKLAASLNEEGRGDWSGFFLRAIRDGQHAEQSAAG
ncbi:class I SAM-dependent methyltransferase [Mycobacterium lehmannii]|uniref:class I SAM-dependent methyltransferase n=1 Tax=Mycobacterium lehmannii TaxID=2048550 RepID=UPI000B93ECCA|nr:class I SAM-dependent methyltransferase [Mycobacterium lehmannii]